MAALCKSSWPLAPPVSEVEVDLVNTSAYLAATPIRFPVPGCCPASVALPAAPAPLRQMAPPVSLPLPVCRL